MKVIRQDMNEQYNTTVGWINSFARNLEKNADYLSNLRSIMKKRNDFSSIEEKMADMKTRAGFDLIKTIDSVSDSNIKSAKKNYEKDILDTQKDILDTLRAILHYIEEFVSDRPDVCYGVILTHCREHPKLGFDKIESKLDHKKLKNLVGDIFKRHKKDPEEVIYISEADMPSSQEGDIADYVSHALTG